MAAGLQAALERLQEIIEGCDANTKWRRSEKRLTLLSDAAEAAGVNEKYWIAARPRSTIGQVGGSHHQYIYPVEIQLGRFFGRGARNSRDWHGIQDSLSAQANIVEQSIEKQPGNWSRATTGIINITLTSDGFIDSVARDLLVWSIDLLVTIRHPDVAASA